VKGPSNLKNLTKSSYTTKPETMSAVFDATPAEKVIREVADIIGADDKTVDQICENMEKELILQEWQLSTLEASEWKALGAPIGLAAAIRKLTSFDDNEAASAHRPRETEAPPNVLTSRSTYAKRLTAATKGLSSSHDEESHPKNTEYGSNIEEGQAEVHMKNSPNTLFQVLYQTRRDALKALHSTAFPMSQTFDRALLHGKSGSDLKAHTVFKMEIGVVVSALLVGAAIELWGVFPQDAIAWDKSSIPNGGEPYVPYQMALVFNALSGLTILVQLVSVFMNVGQLFVATAVADNKFSKFFLQTTCTTAWTNGLFQLGCSAFILNIGILVMALTVSTTSHRATILICGMIIPAMIVIACEVLFHMIVTFVGRTAFNGYLLVPHENPNTDDIIGNVTSAVNAEKAMCQDYYQNLNANDEEVLDRCHRLTRLHTHARSTQGVESKTIRNSKLIVPTTTKHNIGTDYFPKFREPQKL
jgi:hypothetical protein